MEYIFNNIFVRIIAGILIGIPVSVVALVSGAHGLLLGYAGIITVEFWLVLVGIITITGFIGIIGAWRRLIDSTVSMSVKYNNKTRSMLFFGIFTSVALTIWSIVIDGVSEMTLLLIILCMAGVMFIIATPKSSNNTLNSDSAKSAAPVS